MYIFVYLCISYSQRQRQAALHGTVASRGRLHRRKGEGNLGLVQETKDLEKDISWTFFDLFLQIRRVEGHLFVFFLQNRSRRRRSWNRWPRSDRTASGQSLAASVVETTGRICASVREWYCSRYGRIRACQVVEICIFSLEIYVSFQVERSVRDSYCALRPCGFFTRERSGLNA